LRASAALPVDSELALHPRNGNDAAEMYGLVERHRPVLREWLAWVDARTLADVRRYAQYAQAQYESRVAFDFAIRSNGKVVGAIGLHGFDWGNRSAQIGYWLVPDARGRGIVTRAADALVRHAFGPLEIHRLEIRCVVENMRSRAVAERLGFTFEGILVDAHLLHGAFRDIALYAATARTRRRVDDGLPSA
jgi:ribosomal-protein-serine acetyltransferase